MKEKELIEITGVADQFEEELALADEDLYGYDERNRQYDQVILLSKYFLDNMADSDIKKILTKNYVKLLGDEDLGREVDLEAFSVARDLVIQVIIITAINHLPNLSVKELNMVIS